MNNSLHPLLLEQLASAGIREENLPELLPLLEKVSNTYGAAGKEEQKASERNKTLSKENQHLNDSLLKCNKELDRFVYSISHDLRAPIASIKGLLNLTDTEEDPEAIAQYLGLMRNSVVRMERFITNLLNYSKSNRQENTPEKVDFSELIENTASSLRYLPDAFKIDLIQEHFGNCLFYTDLPKLQIILSNLLSNAIQYHNLAQVNPYIKVSTYCNQKEAIIEIQDNGQGIRPAYHKKIFDMFFRANENSRGNGLGLYIVKDTTEKLNGQISFTSAPAKGSTFKLVLPNMFPQIAAEQERKESCCSAAEE